MAEIEAEVQTLDEWVRVLEEAGLREVVSESFSLEARREASLIRQYGVGDFLRMLQRTAVLAVTRSDFRKYMQGQRIPRSTFEYLGYGMFVGRKAGAEAEDQLPASG